jgi:hypothetical protein
VHTVQVPVVNHFSVIIGLTFAGQVYISLRI